MKTTVTVESADFYHLPDWQETQDVNGLTVRQALGVLRGVSWGNMGTGVLLLSDDTSLCVELKSTFSGSQMSSQHVVRRDGYGFGNLIRTYTL